MSDSNSSAATDVHMITMILRVTPSADNPAGRTFDLGALTEAISEACSDVEVYVELDDARGADDYGVFTVDAYEVIDDLAPDTTPDALVGTAPAA